MALSSEAAAESLSVEKRSLSEKDHGKSQDSNIEVNIDFAGESSLPPPPSLTKAEEKWLYRKIDLKLMPILSLMYLGAFLDRGESTC